MICDSGYVGIGECPLGYYNNKNSTSCNSGNNVLYECKQHTDPNCKNGSPVKDECMVCNEGYEVDSSGLCVAKDCGADYAELGQCGAGMWNDDTKDSCQSASTMLYKCYEHKEVEKCASYDEISDVCVDCEYGYVLKGGKCEVNQCKSSYYLVDSCPNGYWQNKTDECKQGEELKYNCVARNNKTGCATYDPYSDTCLSCVSNGYDLVDGKCEVHDCDDNIYALQGKCATGWNAATTDTLCTEGTVKKYECKAHTAPTNLCKTYDKGKDACSVCYEGYTPSGSQCVEVDCGDSYKEYGKCAYENGYYNNDSTGKCVSGTTQLFKCVKNSDNNCIQSSPIEDKCIQCKDGYTPNANGKCVVKNCEGDYAKLGNCGTGKYNNETTNHCKSGEDDLYLCLVNDVANCTTTSKDSNTCVTCDTGYNLKEGKCEINQCGDEYKTSGQCGDGYYNIASASTGNYCDEGSTKKYKCQTQVEVDNCNIYSATSKGCAQCKDGWNEKASSTSCPINTCDNYANVGACTTGWNDNSQKTCNIGTNTVYYCQAHTKVDRCVTYNPRANECAVCTEGYTGAQCTECDTGYKSDGNGVCYPDLNCQHGTTQNGDKCDCADTGFTGDECNVCESRQVEGDYCYPKLECQYGGTQNKNTCECPAGFSGDYCEICPSGDIVETNGVYECKALVGCLHGGTQVNGMCVCKTEDAENTTVANWTGDKCQTCQSGDSLGDTCFAKRTDCNTQNSSGQKYGECVCANGWSGDTCDTCDGLVSDGACIPTYAACGSNGVWSYANNKCECDEGYSGDRCEIAPTIELNCQHGGTPNAEGTACVCTANWSGTECTSCSSGDYEGDTCYQKIDCKNYGTQKKGVCECNFSNWTGADCSVCPNGYVEQTVSGVSLCLTPEENTRGCMFGEIVGDSCECYNGWSGTNCDECQFNGVAGVVKGNVCYEKMDCVNGTQDGGRCSCDSGWTGTYCDIQTTPNNYNFSKTINVTKTDATTGENVVGLEHNGSASNKIGTWTDLYNAYVKDAGTLDDTYQISVNNTNPANSSNTFGMKNDTGNAYTIYVNGINNTIAGVLKSVINVTHETTVENKSASYSMYGIHAENDVVTIKKDGSKANGLDVSSEINVTYKDTYEGTYEADTGVKVELYGIHSKSGDVHNTSNSTINVKSEVTRTAYKPHTYLYGAYSRRGDATNDGIIKLTGATDGPAYGLYAALNAINNNEIQISGEAAAYGIFGAESATSSGSVAVEVSKQGDAYGIRTPGAANLSGTLSVTTKSGAAYGVHANNNITNTNSITTVSGTSAYGLKSNDGKVTSTGGSINVTSTTGSAYGIQTGKGVVSNSDITVKGTKTSTNSVFGISAGDAVTNNGGKIDVTSSSSSYDYRNAYGINTSSGKVTNSGTITVNGNTYGGSIYGVNTPTGIDNTNGTIIATAKGNYTDAYGVYTSSSVDMSKLGTIKASASGSIADAVAVYFGTGSVNLNNTNTANLSASSSYIRYLFEGANGTTITSSANINAGLKAGTVNNSATLSGALYGIYAYNTASNTGTVNATSSHYTSTRGIYAGGTVSNIGGTVNITGNTSDYTSYGIQSNNGGIDNTNGKVTASAGEVYGLYASNETINNTNGHVEVSGSYSGTYTSYTGGIKTSGGNVNNNLGTVITQSKNDYVYGIQTSTGSVNNSEGAVTVNGTHTNNQNVYGIYTSSGEINNGRGSIDVTGISSNVYGIYTTSGVVNNLKGSIKVETVEEATGSAYGIYTKGAIDSNALGSIVVSSENGKAVGVHFEKGTIELTNTNTRDITVTGQERLLFEGATGTTLKNSAIIQAGIKAENVENIGTINGGKYGIYADKTVKNTGTVTAQSDTTAYGIYTNGTLDLSGFTGSVTATAQDKAVGVYFGQGEVEISAAAAGNITVSGSGELYVIEGAEETKVTNNAQFNNGGIKAGDVYNNGIISAGGKYGIYAYNEAVNTAAITSSEYGIYAGGNVDNSANITTTNSYNKAYGIRGDSVKNSKRVTVTSANNVAYGIYALSSVENTGGTINVTSTTKDAYGIYTNGSIDLSKLGTITVKAGATGTAVGVRFANDTLLLTGNHGISITSGLERYLFEGGKNTTINNNATISAGLKAENITNTGTISSSGIRGVWASSNITNSGTIKATANYDSVYGTYLDNVNATFDNTNGKIVATNNSTSSSTVYGIFTKGAVDVNKLGTITASSNTTNGKTIGVHFEDGTLTLNNDLTNFTLTGREKYLFNGGVETKIVNNANLTKGGLSTEQGTIENNVSITTDSSTGIYAKTGTVINSGDISVSGSSGKLYGIRAEEGSTVTNTGNVTVTKSGSSAEAYGVYLDGSTFDNQGAIEVKNTYNSYYSKMYGVYATNGSVVTNSGTIKITSTSGTKECDSTNCKASTSAPTTSTPVFVYTSSDSTFKNNGAVASVASLNLDTDFGEGQVMLAQNGSFSAPSLMGSLGVATDVVEEGFENTYTVQNAIVSDDTTGLNLTSTSALFDATLDGQDVVMNKKDFADVVENASMAEFLENNYKFENNASLFETLKKQNNVAMLNDVVDVLSGSDLKRFNFEDMLMLKEVSADMNNKLFENKNKNEYFTLTGNTNTTYFEENSSANSRWMISGKKLGKKSYGMGIVFSNLRSYDDDSSNNREDESVQLLMPFGYNTHNFEFIAMPRLGYSYGTYTRNGIDNLNYDGTIEKRIFGLNTAFRYPVEVNDWKLYPTMEFNAINYLVDGSEENKPYALDIDRQNITSAEIGVGLNASKSYNFDKNHNMKVNFGLMAYHEFLDPYELKLSMRGMDGSWRIKDERRKDNHITINGGFEYNLVPFAVYGNVFSYIDSEYNTKADLGLKYAF